MFFFTFDLFNLLIGGAIVLAVLWVISTINGFKRREIKIEEALSGIEVALTKRYDMLTKLLDTAKGFMEHESDLFSRVVSLRRGMSVGEMGQADREMSELTGRLFAVAENYPELRSSEVFLELQRGIRDANCSGASGTQRSISRPPGGYIMPMSAVITSPSPCSPPSSWPAATAPRSSMTRTTRSAMT